MALVATVENQRVGHDRVVAAGAAHRPGRARRPVRRRRHRRAAAPTPHRRRPARTARRCGPPARRRPGSMAGGRGVGGREVRLGSAGSTAPAVTVRPAGLDDARAAVGLAQRPRDAGGVAPPLRRTPRGPPDVAARHPPARRPAPARGLGRRRRRRDGPLGPRGRPGVGGVDHRRAARPAAGDGGRPAARRASSGSQAVTDVRAYLAVVHTANEPSRRLFVSGGYAPDLPADARGSSGGCAPSDEVPGERGAALDVAGRSGARPPSSKASVGRPPAGRMERTFSRGHRVAGPHVGDDVEGAAQRQGVALGLGGAEPRGLHRQPGGGGLAHEGGELVGLEREVGVDPAVGARAGSRASRGPRRRGRRPRRRPRCPRCGRTGRSGCRTPRAAWGSTAGARRRGRPGRTRCTPGARSGCSRRPGRRSRAASISPRVAMPLEMIIGLPVEATSPDERQVDELGGGDLVDGAVERLQQLDRGGVEGAGEGDQAALTGALEHRGVPLPGRVRLVVEVVQGAAAPQVVARRGCGTADPWRRW